MATTTILSVNQGYQFGLNNLIDGLVIFQLYLMIFMIIYSIYTLYKLI